MAKRTNFNDVIVDSAGNALNNIQVTVKEGETATNAVIYDTRGGASTKSNPFTTGASGLADFFAEPGTYRITFHDTQLPARVADRTIYFEAVSGDTTGGIPSTQIEGLNGTKINNNSIENEKLNLTATGTSQDTGDIQVGATWTNLVTIDAPGAGTYLAFGIIEYEAYFGAGSGGTSPRSTGLEVWGKFNTDTSTRAVVRPIEQTGWSASFPRTYGTLSFSGRLGPITSSQDLILQAQKFPSGSAIESLLSLGSANTRGNSRLLIIRISD